MAKPNKKGPVRTVQISCQQCKAPLFKYRKNGKGAFVKYFIERIVEDHTDKPCACPGCGKTFARETLIHGYTREQSGVRSCKAHVVVDKGMDAPFDERSILSLEWRMPKMRSNFANRVGTRSVGLLNLSAVGSLLFGKRRQHRLTSDGQYRPGKRSWRAFLRILT